MFQVEDIAALPQSLIFGQGMHLASEDMQITRRVIFYGGGGIRYCPSLSIYFLIKLLNLLPKGKTKQDVGTSIKKYRQSFKRIVEFVNRTLREENLVGYPQRELKLETLWRFFRNHLHKTLWKKKY